MTKSDFKRLLSFYSLCEEDQKAFIRAEAVRQENKCCKWLDGTATLIGAWALIGGVVATVAVLIAYVVGSILA